MTRTSRLALVAVTLTWAGAAHAQLSAALVPSPAPLVTAMTAYATPSSLQVQVTNTSGRVLHRIQITLPNTAYSATGGSGPTGWTSSVPNNQPLPTIRFTNACSGAGLASGATAVFTINFTPPQTSTASDIAASSNFTATGYTRPANGSVSSCPTAYTSNGATFTAPVKVLLVSGSVSQTQFFTGPATVTSRWSIFNRSSQKKFNVTLEPVVTPAATSTNCNTIDSLDSQNTTAGIITCTHVLPAGGTYTFAANVSGRVSAGGAIDARAVGAYATTGNGTNAAVQVGNPVASWTQRVMVQGRRLPYTVVLSVANASPLAIAGVTVGGVSGGGFTLLNVSATNGLRYVSASGGTLTFTGSLAAGATSIVTVQLGGTPPTTNTTYVTQVVMTASNGATATSKDQVSFVIPLPDVIAPTILSTPTGQSVAWTNPTRADSPQDGVVVFRTAMADKVPPKPTDFVDYQAHPTADVAYADPRGSRGAASTFGDDKTGDYYYRVCNRDAYLVYSDCVTGFPNPADPGNENDKGFASSVAAPPGGWALQLGGDDTVQIGTLTLDRAAIPSNRPDVTVVQLSTGHGVGVPLALPAGSLPPANSPSIHVTDGRWLSFTADQAGNITAIDLQTGAQAWRVTKVNRETQLAELFTAGVSAITRASAPRPFQDAFTTDVLFLGSASTGTVYAVRALDGATLWTVNLRALVPGVNVYALTTYDASTNFVYVPTSAGVFALDLGTANDETPASVPTGWPAALGDYRRYCVPTTVPTAMACLDNAGLLHVINRKTGKQSAATLDTKVPGASYFTRIANGTPGFVVASTSLVRRVTADATLSSPQNGSLWAPGQRLSAGYTNSAAGWIVVGSSDLRLHKLSSETLAELGTSSQITVRIAGTLLGPPAFDPVSQRFVFGTSEGRVWAIPVF